MERNKYVQDSEEDDSDISFRDASYENSNNTETDGDETDSTLNDQSSVESNSGVKTPPLKEKQRENERNLLTDDESESDDASDESEEHSEWIISDIKTSENKTTSATSCQEEKLSENSSPLIELSDDEDYEPSEQNTNDKSEDDSQYASPPSKFMPPLARSSLLPVPNTLLQNPVRTFTSKYLPVPEELYKEIKEKSLNKSSPKQEELVIIGSSDEDDSDVVVIDSYEDGSRLSRQPVPGKTIIPESDDSSRVTTTSAALNGDSSGDSSWSPPNAPLSDSDQSNSSQKSSTSSKNSSQSSHSELKLLKAQIEAKAHAYRNFMTALKGCDPRKLKDGGKLLRENVDRCRLEMEELKARYNECCSNASDEPIIEAVNIKQNIAFSVRDQNVANLGQKGLETHRIQKAMTIDALVSLHSSLATTPNVDVLEEPPAGLLIDLMPHQRQALAWLLHRETQSPPGGILADDMGLGKTLSMISLVMRSSELENQDEDNDKPSWKMAGLTGPGHPGKTLVVCPASLIGQWEGQVKQHVRRGRVTTLVHHGNNREGRGRALTGADIVITTYGVLAHENKSKGALFRVAWKRIILDEAHTIRNHKTQAAIAACELQAKYRWCLTGTPVHNKELDIYSLLKFLRCHPFDNLLVWKQWVDNKTAQGMERLNTVVRSILLRRTKEELKSAGHLQNLSNKSIHSIRVKLDEPEMIVYQSVLHFSKTLVAQYLQQRTEKDGGLTSYGVEQLQSRLRRTDDIKTHDILVLLLRLRQICCLPGLISAMLEEDAAAADGLDKEDPVVEDLFKQVRRLTISAPPPEEDEPRDLNKVLLTSNPVFDVNRSSSKMIRVSGIVRDVITTGDKIVVVSQWSSFLRLLASHLKKIDVKFTTLDGSVPVKDRGTIVDTFNNPDSRVRVMLLSLTAGGVGLNLVGANHLIIMEPHWNPQLESQACDRVYRVGQKKPVHIYKVICSDTIEERIEALQEKKLQLSETVLKGQMKKEISKLSLQDIKSLFGLESGPRN